MTLTRSQAARRQRVIEAAVTLGSAGGYDAVQMREVASTADVALGTIYRYFSSKDHLLAAALVEWWRSFDERLAQKPPKGETASDRVADVVRRASRAMERRPQLTAALVTAITRPDPAVAECQREVTAVVGSAIQRAMDGEVDPARADRIVRILDQVWFAVLVGWVNGWSSVSQVGDDLEAAARILLEP
jgi:AcrR family transcriptional regulator